MTAKAGQKPEAAARKLMELLGSVRAEIAASAARAREAWGPAGPDAGFEASVANLSDYIALRQMDLRRLQGALATLGLSSLGRCEAHVGATLDAVLASLARIAGDGSPPYPDRSAFLVGSERLARRRDAVFGQGRAIGGTVPDTRIMATLPGEAASDADLVRRICGAGVDCVRINCAHDGPDAWAAMIRHVRAAAGAEGRDIPVSMDLGGPKIRTTATERADGLRLHRGDCFALARTAADAAPFPAATLSHPDLIDRMVAGTSVWIDDGKLRARVVERRPGMAVLEVTGAREKGEKLKPEKGVGIPGLDLSIPALTADDLRDLDFVAAAADVVGYSFVQTADDVRDLVAALRDRCGTGPLPAIMLKIETTQAVRNLPELIVTAGRAAPVAVMIARGDLAVEIGFERLSEIQDEILWLCEAAQIPVVWATQVLDGLLHEGQASRAEATDAARGQRADCVMLNKGPFLPEAIGFLRSVLARMDRHHSKKFAHLGPLRVWRAE